MQKAIDAGELAKADALLADVETEQRRALDRLAVNAADTSARRGEIALTRLRYREAAMHFANAAAVLPEGSADEDNRIGYLGREAHALYLQGDEFGDNGALLSAIERYKRLVALMPRERVPLQWAVTQNSLGNALQVLGQRESSTAKLDEAVAAYREALKEWTRNRVPLNWAGTQNNLGGALQTLGNGRATRPSSKRPSSPIARRWELPATVPLDWAMTRAVLGLCCKPSGNGRATRRSSKRPSPPIASAAGTTRERVPLDWAT